MFKSAVIRLTLGYVGALTFICLLFSLPVYNIATSRLKAGAERQTEFIRNLPVQNRPRGLVSDLVESRDNQLREDRNQLLFALMTFNISIISLGAYASYYFARQTLKPLHDAHKLQKAFTANASHELRTPLAVMQTQIEVALRDKKLNIAEAKSTLQSNLEEVSRLQELSDQLLALTSTSDISSQFEKINLAKITKDEIRQYQKIYKIKINSKNISDCFVSGDKTLLRQAIGILIDNAISYSSDSEKKKVEVSVTAKKNFALVEVKDNGPGINKNEISDIFKRFYRGDASELNSKGNGLGLSIASQIVELHNAEISVKSKINFGSTFTIKIPKVS